jgi:uncharacterized membrane protein
MGYIVGWFAEKKPFSNETVNNIVSILIAMVVKVVGYYFAEVILYGNWLTPLGSILGNVLQVGVAGLVVVAIIPQFRKVLGMRYN